MKRVSLILALHNHQPVGNFDHVFEECTRRSYLPVLDTWAEFPHVPLSLHNSGILWDWLGAHHPEYLGRVAAMVSAGQLELLTGGYYEPILAAIPDADKVGQVRKLSAFLESRFGARPETLWLTERVWEPGLPAPLAEAGVRAVLVDDEHFHAAGVPHRDLAGCFRTEEGGGSVGVFPILKELRYLIPFHPPEETLAFLRDWADDSGERVAVLGDDGEKFGVWPGTHKSVFEEGWLRRFLELLSEQREWLEVTTPSRWMAAHPPRGLVYLPTASYTELTEWALPTAAQSELAEVKRRTAGVPGVEGFLRGGFWRNFLSKYPESNRMHKRALDLSRRIHELPDGRREAALDPLWQAQCNCAYWHGVFGGLYLPHLRDAVHRRLQQAETALDQARGLALSAREVDLYNEEGRAWVLRNAHVSLGVAPDMGGMLFEWADARTGHDLGNTLARRAEAYHHKVAGAVYGASQGGSVSLETSATAKEPDLERLLVADRLPRASLQDHILAPETSREDFARSAHEEWGEFAGLPYAAELDWDRGKVSMELRRRAWAGPARATELEIVKRITLREDDPGFEVRIVVSHVGGVPIDARFGVEWNLTFLTGEADDRWADFFEAGGRERMGAVRGLAGVRRVRAADEWLDLAVETTVEPAAGAWTFPVETVSYSEAGFERVYQGTCVLFLWPHRLAAGESLELRVEPRHGHAAAAPAAAAARGDSA
ncbi:MAG: DUF1926 domain-containing protein [Candidatus Eisenbacteria bacterium]|nr:DUF1926 domain-containing protein [Candidatus Eisenbacteria bacterium]